MDSDASLGQLAELRLQIDRVKEEARKLADEYNKTDNGKDDGYVALLHSVPEELSCIGYTLINLVNLTNWNNVLDKKTEYL